MRSKDIKLSILYRRYILPIHTHTHTDTNLVQYQVEAMFLIEHIQELSVVEHLYTEPQRVNSDVVVWTHQEVYYVSVGVVVVTGVVVTGVVGVMIIVVLLSNKYFVIIKIRSQPHSRYISVSYFKHLYDYESNYESDLELC